MKILPTVSCFENFSNLSILCFALPTMFQISGGNAELGGCSRNVAFVAEEKKLIVAGIVRRFVEIRRILQMFIEGSSGS